MTQGRPVGSGSDIQAPVASERVLEQSRQLGVTVWHVAAFLGGVAESRDHIT